MATIRNTLIAAFRLTGWNNLKQARRHFSHAINRCVDLITKPPKTVNIKHDGTVGRYPGGELWSGPHDRRDSREAMYGDGKDTAAEVTHVDRTDDKDVVELLLGQHTQIKNLFRGLSQAQGERKRDLFEDLVRLLAVHESAEEIVVHPTARREIDNGDEVVEARVHEEGEAKQALAELYDLGVDHPDFDTKLAELAEDVVDHANHEEREEFSQLRAKLPEDRLRRMAGAVRAAEATAPTRPHPRAGESAVANIVAGPPIAVFDRVRDAVRDWTQSKR
jgi:hemerythrin superfamily protein